MQTVGLSCTVLAGVGITAADDTDCGEPLEDPIPGSIKPASREIRLETVTNDLTAPNWGTATPGCGGLRNRLVVTDQDGIFWAVNLTTGDKSVLLDVSDRLVSLGVAGPGTFDERGLLGVAFHPEFADNGLLYTYTSEPVDGDADFSTIPAGESPNHQSVISEWQIPKPCDPSSVVDPASRSEMLRIDQPQFNHNGGALVFGADEQLYVSLGDGGGADDQGVGHVPGGNGQDPSNVLDTILRIDPGGDDSANGQYGIPSDNPFVSESGFLDEIFAYGLRNPFRFSFDNPTGEMYIADVGQNDIEEIDLGVAGGNYGWRIKEGSFCFCPNGADPGFVFECELGDASDDLIDPIAEYDHDEGIAIVGGFVYRGRNPRGFVAGTSSVTTSTLGAGVAACSISKRTTGSASSSSLIGRRSGSACLGSGRMLAANSTSSPMRPERRLEIRESFSGSSGDDEDAPCIQHQLDKLS